LIIYAFLREEILGCDRMGMDNPGGVADDDQGSGWFEVKKVSLPELILILLDV